MSRPSRSLLLFLVMILIGSSRATADEVPALIRYVPETANVVAVIRVQDILNTRRARREQWAKQQRERFLAGADTIPPWVESVVLASLVHLEVPEELWTIGLYAVPEELKMSDLAQRENSEVEQVLGHSAVRSARDAYFVQLDRRVIGVRSPAFRQDVGRWVQLAGAKRESQLTPYLQQVVETPAPIAIGLDAQAMFGAEHLRRWLQASPSLRTEPAAVEPLVQLLASLLGVRFEVEIGMETQASVQFDFSTDVAPEGRLLQPLFLEVLAELGAQLKDFENAAVRLNGQSVLLRTTLSDTGLRRVLSLIHSPRPAPQQAPVTAASNTPVDRGRSLTSEGNNSRASKKYLESVDRVLDDLEWTAETQGEDFVQTASWNDSFARKIDNLPHNNVDPKLLAYGSSISAKLRALAASMRGVAVDVDTQQDSITYQQHFNSGWSTYNFFGGWGFRPASVNVTSNVQQVRQNQARAITQGAKEREQIWQSITAERNRIRQWMQQKQQQNSNTDGNSPSN